MNRQEHIKAAEQRLEQWFYTEDSHDLCIESLLAALVHAALALTSEPNSEERLP